ncbi:hypothetical protein CTI12_AA395210 [Artemisia annua]|uniref:Helitron helicase-like domain-containing protein n=1 Tax=Artemisia annua TaxID=35608 RepID=A0A2U1MC07_ARTAN|nr:hypothetical protein CTI12_AA395210 [Artemisia annua]
MKEKQIPSSENVKNSSTLKLPEKNAPIIHESLGCQLYDVTGNIHLPQLERLQPLCATHDGSAKDLFEGQNPSITKREMDFYYGGHTGVVSPPPSNFFGPRRRKPISSKLGLPKHSSQKCVGMACNETICRVTEGADPQCLLQSSTANHPNSDGCLIGGVQRPTSDVLQGSAVRHAQSSSGLMPFAGGTVAVGDDAKIGVVPDVCHEVPSEKRKRCRDEMLPKHRTQITSDDGAHIVAQPSDSYTDAVQPPKRTRRRGQPCINNDACHSASTTQALATNACSVIQPSSSQGTQNVVEPQKRSRRRKQPSASDVGHHSPTNTQASASHACSVTEPSDSHIVADVAQPRKRIRRTPQASTQSTNNIAETSTSHAPPEMANPHANQSATQPQKRNARTRRSSTRRPNDHSQNISEGSTSHTLENTSPTYEDLGDCTECCNYCNAAFWRGERLAGRSYSTHVSHYHLCCGNDSPPLDPEVVQGLIHFLDAHNELVQMFRTARDKFAQADVPTFKIRLYSGEGPRDSPPLDPEVVQGLIHFLDAHNELVQMFRTARDKFAQADVPTFKIRLYSGEGPRGYELSSSNSLGAIVFDRGPESELNYDVVLEYRDGPVKRISKIHKSYMSLQFPLIFIYGQPGFHTKLMLRTANPDDEPKRVSMNAFYTYQLHPRHDNTSPTYEDLGDCTECCNYCNATFWRGERLADSPPLDPEVVQGLIHFLDAHNELVQMFRTARDKCAQADVPEFKIRLYSGEGPRGYELPSSNSLGAIVFYRGPESELNYDVVLEYRDGPVKRISKIHKSYMSLQFPLIFIYGQPGFHTKLMLRTANPDDEPKRNETADIINSKVLDMVDAQWRKIPRLWCSFHVKAKLWKLQVYRR